MTTAADAKPSDRRMIRLPLVLAVLGVLIILTSTSRYGAGCSTDCVHYVSAARNLLSGRGYVAYGGVPFVEFPPLFPTLLALIGLTGVDPFVAARYVNATCFGLIVAISGLWLLKHIRSRTLAIVGSLGVLLSIPLMDICVMAMSEPLFIVLALLFLLQMEVFLSSGKSLPFYVAALLAALACLTRYIGITVVATGLFLLLIKRDTPLTRRAVKAVSLVLICALPLSAWASRNYSVASTLTGTREPSSYTWRQVIYFTLDTATSWFMPPSSLVETETFSTLPEPLQGLVQFLTLPPATRIAVGTPILLLITGASMFAIWRGRHHLTEEGLLPVMPAFCFLITYTGTLMSIVGRMRVLHFPPINNRYLSPVYVPFWLLIIFAFHHIAQFSRDHSVKPTRGRLLAAGFAILIVYPLLSVGAMSINHIRNGAGGYSHISYQSSPMIAYLRKNPVDDEILSNRPDGVYFLTGLPARLSPTTFEHAVSLKNLLLSSTESACLVWFDDGWGSPLGVGALDCVFEIKTIKTFSDGTVYLIH